MRKIFIIFCCGLLLLTCGCSQKDEVTPTVSTVKTVSEIIKTEEEKPPVKAKYEPKQPKIRRPGTVA